MSGALRSGMTNTYVRTQLEVARPPDDVLVVRVVKMTVHDLFGHRQWSLKPGRRQLRVHSKGGDVRAPITYDSEVVLDTLVVDVRVRFEQRHGDLLVANLALGDGGHAGGQSLD